MIKQLMIYFSCFYLKFIIIKYTLLEALYIKSNFYKVNYMLNFFLVLLVILISHLII
jgi:hypothetical protein